MSVILALILSVMGCVSAQAASMSVITLSDGSQWLLIDPPQRWVDRPFTGPIDTRIRPDLVIKEMCSIGAKMVIRDGCAFPAPDKCIIYLSNELPPKAREQILVHELAHCAGWGADHPD